MYIPQSGTVIETDISKAFKSKNYNYIFDKNTGFFARWGNSPESDPEWSPFGPELVDIEISTICSGVEGIGPCKFCYKSNTKNGKYMSLDLYKRVFDSLPKTVTQIAFGIGDITSNPDLWSIMEYTKSNGVVSNITINAEGITDEIAEKLVSHCGAIAVSVYDAEKSYNVVKKLTDMGLKQCNIHFMLCDETYKDAFNLLHDRVSDERLSKLNAIVFLSLKPKGRANTQKFTKLSDMKFKNLIDFALEYNISTGFDSCSALKFMKSVEGNKNEKTYAKLAEPCESTKFSVYCNVDGKFYPCSFIEGEICNGVDWTEGLPLLDLKFMDSVWMHDKTKNFRDNCISCIKNKISCPHYKI